jgi:hypothetical protein
LWRGEERWFLARSLSWFRWILYNFCKI